MLGWEQEDGAAGEANHSWSLTYPRDHHKNSKKIKSRQPRTPACGSKAHSGSHSKTLWLQKGSRTRACYCCYNSWGRRKEKIVFMGISVKKGLQAFLKCPTEKLLGNDESWRVQRIGG